MDNDFPAGDLVEVYSEDFGVFQRDFICHFYRQSVEERTFFVLNAVSPQSVDFALDGVVASMPLSIAGVRYVDIKDESRLKELIDCCRRIWVATLGFRAQLAELGVAEDRILSRNAISRALRIDSPKFPIGSLPGKIVPGVQQNPTNQLSVSTSRFA